VKNYVLVFFVSMFLVACGSTVPLNDVPVSDATAKSVGAVGEPSASTGVQRGVAPVVLGDGQAQIAVNAESRLIYFDFDSFVIKPEFQAVIAAHARFIKSQATRKVAIEGHTDEIGGREYNLALGQKRAEAVSSALAILGVPQNQMEAVSFGKEKPAVSGSDESAWSKNRRAEIRYQ
jgi:peptidoglycan-associated lipoprotein